MLLEEFLQQPGFIYEINGKYYFLGKWICKECTELDATDSVSMYQMCRNQQEEKETFFTWQFFGRNHSTGCSRELRSGGYQCSSGYRRYGSNRAVGAAWCSKLSCNWNLSRDQTEKEKIRRMGCCKISCFAAIHFLLLNSCFLIF